MNIKTLKIQVLVWILLMTATISSVSISDGSTVTASHIGLLFIIFITFFKTRLVLQHFMEVKGAPIQLKLLSDGWILANTASLSYFFVIA